MTEYSPVGPFCGRGDPLYAEAVKAVHDNKRASVTTVQRVLRIGYNRASHMIEAMEADGIISAQDYKGDRQILAALDTNPEKLASGVVTDGNSRASPAASTTEFCTRCDGRQRTTAHAVPCTRCGGSGYEP